jgi:hypothetical protein
MKKDQINSRFKETKGKGNEDASMAVRVLEPTCEGNRRSDHSQIEAAYADLQNQYKKAG